MPIVNFLHHLIDFHGKASRREFILIFVTTSAYLASLAYFASHNMTFDLGAIGFAIFIAVSMLSALIQAATVCRRNASAELSENYLVLWFFCHVIIAFHQKLGGFSEVIALGCLVYIFGYYASLMIIKPHVFDE